MKIDLVKELYTFAVQYSRSCARGSSDADDFLQEILIVFLEVADTYILPKEQLLVVARSAARNRVRDLVKYRGLRLRHHAPLEDGRHVFLDEEKLQLAKLILRDIEAKVSARTVQVLDFLKDGFTRKEVAKRLEISQMTVHRSILEARTVYGRT